MAADLALQGLVRAAVDEVATKQARLHVTHTMASVGWGGVLFVDVYAQSKAEALEDLDPVLRRHVAAAANLPYERVTVRWRIDH